LKIRRSSSDRDPTEERERQPKDVGEGERVTNTTLSIRDSKKKVILPGGRPLWSMSPRQRNARTGVHEPQIEWRASDKEGKRRTLTSAKKIT